MDEGREVNGHAAKAKVLFDYYCNIIGSFNTQTLNFDLSSLFQATSISQQEAISPCLPWTESDIRTAISTWKGNRSPGPDGFSGEFYNTFIELLLPDIKEVYCYVNAEPNSTLFPLNDSFIVLVPKKEGPLTPSDFRPISLVNAIQRIYSKIVAAKIRPLLDKLLSSNQTGFLKRRSILHSFYYAQQIIQTASRQKSQIAVFKADIYKAFDTVDWNFLLRTLHARGFPNAWIQCIAQNVLQGSSRVLLNSVAGKAIKLRRGVRQGDPLSPYLFILAMDFLSKWIQKLSDLNFIVPPFPQCKACLLYADDTLLLLKPTSNQLDKVKLIFLIFGQISGLKINLAKSELALTSSPLSFTQSLAAVIQCKSSTFPIKYLGLPFSDKPLSRSHYNSLVDKAQSLLAKWKAPLLSIGGRMILVNAVMSAVPLFFMSAFLLPKWVLTKMDKVRRNFLWHGHKDLTLQLKRLYMVNWTLVTRPRESGGLGVRNISVVNQTLLMKWLWLWHQDEQAWWKGATQMRAHSERPWDDSNATTFWKRMKALLPAFNCSIRFDVGNGKKTQFWHDQWLGAPLKTLFPNLYNLTHTKHASVQQCFHTNGWNIQHAPLTTLAQLEKIELLLHLQNFRTSQSDDKVKWLRAPDFSVSSAYNFLTDTPSPLSEIKNIWSIKAPLRVQIFAWLLLNDRLTTTDNLVKRG